MSDQPSQIFCEIDLQANGKHQGFLRLPHSVHRSAYGWIPIPIASIKNGAGPTVLLMGGNHGDEYEGQVALCKLIRKTIPEDINGQIIILPMSNFPAAKAGMRTSPIDQGNLNRSFPGDPQGNPTQMIAHYIETELLERADFLLDIHSGGSSMLYIPSLLMERAKNPHQQKKNLALLKSMDFPQVLLFDSSDNKGHYSSSAAQRKNCIPITAEVAGGGTIYQSALQLLEKGLYQYLQHIEIISEVPEQEYTIDTKPTEFFQITGEENYCYATDRGLFEPLIELGDEVEKGQLAGRIHDPETPWKKPTDVKLCSSGRVLCKRIPARVERGDCLFEIGFQTA